MAYKPLTELDDWHLTDDGQDIRGWRVADVSGDTFTHVDELLVNTDTQLVEAVRLENGKEIPSMDIEIGDHVVYVRGERPAFKEETEPVVKVYRDARIRRRDGAALSGTSGAVRGPGTGAAAAASTGTTLAVPTGTLGGASGTPGRSESHQSATAPTFPTGFNELHNDFHGHYRSMFGDTGRNYSFYEPAYAYGYRCAIDDTYSRRDYTEVEPEIRRTYESEHGEGSWDHVHGAIRQGYMRGLGYMNTRRS